MATIPQAQRYNVKDFQAEFPNDEACLDWLRDRLYPEGIHCPKCDRVTKHHRVMSRKSYSCQNCGHHVHPTADTIFHKSSTSLTTWFYAIFIMSQTRCGISAKQLQRETGVTYKTAWRMFNQIRKLLVDDGTPLGGKGESVEMDETYMGGRRRGSGRGRSASAHKTPVFAVVERSGRVVPRVVPDARRETLFPIIREYVLPHTMIYTDEWGAYDNLAGAGRSWTHRRIPHAQKVYVMGDVHTNTIEGFWSLVKTGIRGVNHSVSKKHLQSYLDEYAFRYNHRDVMQPMFKLFLANLRKAVPATS